jgi:hypothetical protein
VRTLGCGSSARFDPEIEAILLAKRKCEVQAEILYLKLALFDEAKLFKQARTLGLEEAAVAASLTSH